MRHSFGASGSQAHPPNRVRLFSFTAETSRIFSETPLLQRLMAQAVHFDHKVRSWDPQNPRSNGKRDSDATLLRI